MTVNERERMEYLETTVIDRERRLLSYARMIRFLTKTLPELPKDIPVDYDCSPEEAKVLGILDYERAMSNEKL